MKMFNLKYLKKFGFRLWFVQILLLIVNKFKVFPSWKVKLGIKKNKFVENYIENKYRDIVVEYENIKNQKGRISNKIWILWWQGLNQAPEMIQKCIKVIQKHCNDKEIIILSKDNISDYYQIPNYIKEKVEKGSISFTFLSDVIRMNLLNKYGGFWIDSTVLLTNNPFPKGNFKEFFTIKAHCKEKNSISKRKWTSFFLGGENGILYSFMVKIFNEYLSEHDSLIDYFLVDYCINIIYNHNETVKNKFDRIKYNNESIHELQKILNNTYNNQILDNLKKINNVHKLSFKEYIDFSKEDSFYSIIFNKE